MRVLVVEDHPLFRRGVVALLEAADGLTVAGTAATGEEAVRLAADVRPDVVLMDLQLPGISGIEATRAIVTADPEARVLVLTLFEDEDSVLLALRAGARGYVLKDADEDELTGAIRAVARGEAIFSRAVAGRVLAFLAGPRPAPPVLPELTDREREILGLIAQGHPNPSIARRLSLSPKTVANYVSAIFAKLRVADRAEAMVRARGRPRLLTGK
ncbi:MAG: response regulator transcription factor [Actinomycetota bacterium]|nr:response regulator transcription factor [Actinomycetota bacterium]